MIDNYMAEQIKLLNIKREEIVKHIQRSKDKHTLGKKINDTLKARTTPNLIFYGFSQLLWNGRYVATIICQSYTWEMIREYDSREGVLSVRNSEYEPIPRHKFENRWDEGQLDEMVRQGMLPEILNEMEQRISESRVA